MDIRTAKIKLKSTTPVIFNRPREVDTLGISDEKKTEWLDKTSEEKQTMAHLHKDKKGIYFPSQMIKKMLEVTGTGIKPEEFGIKKLGKIETARIIREYIRVAPSEIYLKYEKEPYIWVRPGQQPKSGAPITIERPRLDNWECEFELTYDATIFKTVESIRNILELASFRTGLGADRPEKGKEFGQFKVVECKLLK